jgi:hypothetical protein
MSSPAWLGGAFALAIAVALYTRFSLDDSLSRDEAIYAYGGQQLAAGVPPYLSIFDPKAPLATLLAGVGAAIAPGGGADAVQAIRLAFFIAACSSVVAVYALGLALWRSALAAVVGAAVFVAFKGFAIDALGGPDAKTPGILLGVVSMALLVRRRWLWGALAGSLASLAWQPLGVYAAVAVAAAALTSERGEQWRHARNALVGAAIPLVATAVGMWLAGALPSMIEATIRFPLSGLRHHPETVGQRIGLILATLHAEYGPARLLLWSGVLGLAAVVAVRIADERAEGRGIALDPGVGVVVASALALVAFTLHDFEGYPDVYPFLPYAAIGAAGAAALVLGRLGGRRPRAAATVGLAALVALGVVTWSWYSEPRARDTGLVRQRADAAAVERLLDPGERLYALGDPVSLVLTGRRNPSRFIYLSSGVAAWALRHHLGGFRGFVAGIRARAPALVVVNGWRTPLARRTERWLSARYDPRCLGSWLLFLAPRVLARASPRGVRLEGAPRFDCRPGR